MQVFRIETQKYPTKEYINTILIRNDTRGILYYFSGCADTNTILKCFNSRLNKLADDNQVDLSTQIAITVGIDQNGFYRGFTIVFISNSISYCMLLGMDKYGRMILSEEIDKKVTDKTVAELKKKLKRRKLTFEGVLNSNDLKLKDAFDDLYFKILSEETERYKKPDIIQYSYTQQDVERLGRWKDKWNIKTNLGKLAGMIPDVSNLSSQGGMDTCLYCKKGFDDFGEDYFRGLFRPFNNIKIHSVEDETIIEFKDKKDCALASMLYKIVKIGENEEIHFTFPRKCQYDEIVG